MGELAKALQAEIQQVEGDKVLVPRMVWDSLLDAIEDYGLLKAMEEADRTELISKGEALEYLEKLERSKMPPRAVKADAFKEMVPDGNNTDHAIGRRSGDQIMP